MIINNRIYNDNKECIGIYNSNKYIILLKNIT